MCQGTFVFDAVHVLTHIRLTESYDALRTGKAECVTDARFRTEILYQIEQILRSYMCDAQALISLGSAVCAWDPKDVIGAGIIGHP